jgi:hypothetical protein
MADIIRHSETCTVKQAHCNKSVEAAVHEFKDKDRLVVILNQSIKLPMKWNGRLYEGKMAGIDFISTGPSITKTQTTIRG